ncbi:MAG TPA: T9SS type A sorting domain-containing protein [Tenuifilaceae bacterium]|nr:T9SS type A sorting domain-containing protein [Tenuifilaceae bacterium]
MKAIRYKIINILCILLLASSGTYAQNLTRAEYFFDTDVGLGMANPITFTAGTEVDFTADIPLTGLEAGYHTLFIRFANEEDVWGHYESRTIYIQPNTEVINPQLVGAEYFFDTDPGIGSGTPIGITAGMDVDFTAEIPTNGLEPGYHTLFIRFVDENELWGHLEGRTVYIQPHSGSITPVLAGAEYFFDTDPGIGNGEPIDITPGMELDFTAEVATNGLEPGYHTLFIRFMDENELWGHYEGRTIYVQSSTSSEIPELIGAEYFFDTDPGIGNGTSIQITPGIDINFTTDISTTGLESGYHTLFIRFMDENELWGHYEARTIYVQPNVSSQTFMLSEAEYFIDTDPGIGNGTPIAFTAGNEASFTFDVPTDGLSEGSTHDIFVRFMNEDGTWGIYEYGEFSIADCMESEPEFSYDDICVGGEATFTDESSVVYPGVSYEWDIGNDGTVEYTTIGNITHTFSEVGIYSVSLKHINADGCVKMVIHEIKVYPYPNIPVIEVSGDLDICDNSSVELSVQDIHYSYLWSNNGESNSIIVSQAGDYSVTVANEIGCSATSETVSVTTKPTYNVTDEVTICGNENYEFGTQTLSESGEYTETFTSILGCDSTVTLTLNVNPVYDVVVNESICEGETFTFNETDYTETGQYVHNLQSVLGCDSIVTLNLAVNPVYNEVATASICDGDEYIFGTQTLTESGEYIEVFESIGGCDSTVNLTFTVNETFNKTASASICQGETYTFGTQNLTESGEYTEVFESELGCDSTVVLTLTINPTYSTTVNESICDGETYTFNETDYTEPGQYVHNLQSVLGCDSIVTLNLTVNPVYNEVATASICDGDEYIFGTQTLTESGEYIEVFESIGGCDSTVNLTFTVNETFNKTASASICQGETYTFGTQNLTESGEYTEVFESELGCDSTVVLTLTINPTYSTTVNESICDGETYTFNETDYTEPGQYVHNLQSVLGCDSIVTLNLTVNPVYNEVASTSICNGDEYVFGTQTLTEPGEYTEVFESELGCDSTVVLTLTVNESYNETATATICQGETYTFGTQGLTESGEYTEFFESEFGCDSTVVLSLTVNETFNETATAQICQGETFVFGTQNLTESGEYTEVFESELGCDSTVVLTLTVNPTYNTTVYESICNGETFTFNETDYTEAGQYVHNLQSAFGCDSIVTLNLTVNPVFNEVATASICNGDEYVFGTQILTEPGEYSEVYESEFGCDSTVTLTLDVITVNVSVSVEGNTLTANATDATYQWLDCNNSYEPIEGETGQSYTPLQNGNYAVEITQNGCTQTSDCIEVTGVSIDQVLIDCEFSIFPNPNSGEFRIILSQSTEIKIFNTLGEIVYSKHFYKGEYSISLVGLPNGLYIIKGQNGESCLNKNLIINR